MTAEGCGSAATNGYEEASAQRSSRGAMMTTLESIPCGATPMIRSAFRLSRLAALVVPALALVAALVPSAPAAPLDVDKDVVAAQAARVKVIKDIAPAVVAVLNQ